MTTTTIYKGFLIDPDKKEIKEIEVTEPVLDSLYSHMGCEYIEGVSLSNVDHIWIDEEGLLKPNSLFNIKNYLCPIAGKAIVLGVDSAGENANAEVSLEVLRKEVISFY